MTPDQLDICSIDASEREGIVLRLFDSLFPGDSILLISDGDPSAVFSFFEKKRPGAFIWDLAEKNSVHWKANISKVPEEGCCGICGDH